MSSVTKFAKKAVSTVSGFLGGGSSGGGSGSSSTTSSNVAPVTNVSTNIDFKDLAEATKTAAQLSSDAQKQIAAAELQLKSKVAAENLKLAAQSNAEKNKKFDLLLKNGQYAAIGISALAAYWIYKNKTKKGKK